MGQQDCTVVVENDWYCKVSRSALSRFLILHAVREWGQPEIAKTENRPAPTELAIKR